MIQILKDEVIERWGDQKALLVTPELYHFIKEVQRPKLQITTNIKAWRLLTDISDDTREVFRVNGLDDRVVKESVFGIIGGAFVAHFPAVDGLVLAPAARPLTPLLLLLLRLGRRRRVARIIFAAVFTAFAVLQAKRGFLRIILRRRIVASAKGRKEGETSHLLDCSS